MKKESVESPLLADQLREWLTMVGRSKSTESVQTALAIPVQFSILRLAVLLGHWGTRNSLLTPSQKKEAQALEALGSELLAWRAEARGLGVAAHESIRIPYSKRFVGKS
jgi:hypothetical protein